MITRDGKPKFETHEVEAPKKEKWKTKKKLKLQRKREKKKRKVANKRDPRRLGVKGKKKQKFDTPEERIKHKIENVSYRILFFIFKSSWLFFAIMLPLLLFSPLFSAWILHKYISFSYYWSGIYV